MGARQWLDTFCTDATSVCPYPYCGGQVRDSECPTCGCRSVTCSACRTLNRLDARYCRHCGGEISREESLPLWSFQIEAAATSPSAPGTAVPLLTNPSLFHLANFGLEGPGLKSLAQPVLTQRGLILPHPALKALTLYVPRDGRDDAPIWTRELRTLPGIECTPIVWRSHLYVGIPGDAEFRFAQIRVDTGDLELLDIIGIGPSPGQSPVFASSDSKAAVVWPLADGLAVLRLDEDESGRSNTRAQHATCHLQDDEFILSPVASGRFIYALTNKGRLYSLEWTKPWRAIRLQGLWKRSELAGNWRCGPPTLLGGNRLACVALKLDDGIRHYNDAGQGSLSFILWQEAAKPIEIALRGDDDAEFARCDSSVLRYPPAFDETRLYLPSGFKSGFHSAIVSGGQCFHEFIPTRSKFSGSRVDATHGFVTIVSDDTIAVAERLHQGYDAKLQTMKLSFGASGHHALAAPVLGPDFLALLCDGVLAVFPTQ